SPVPDTLYWKRYMPLEVGNVWEYAVSEGEPLLRQEIVQDTFFRGQRYYAVEETSYAYSDGSRPPLPIDPVHSSEASRPPFRRMPSTVPRLCIHPSEGMSFGLGPRSA